MLPCRGEDLALAASVMAPGMAFSAVHLLLSCLPRKLSKCGHSLILGLSSLGRASGQRVEGPLGILQLQNRFNKGQPVGELRMEASLQQC